MFDLLKKIFILPPIYSPNESHHDDKIIKYVAVTMYPGNNMIKSFQYPKYFEERYMTPSKPNNIALHNNVTHKTIRGRKYLIFFEI